MMRSRLPTLLVASLMLSSLVVLGGPSADVQAVDDPEPRVEEYVWEGNIACALASPTGGTVACGLNDNTHPFTAREGLRSIVVAMHWTPSPDNTVDGLAIDLSRTYEEIGSAPGVTVSYAYTYIRESGPPGVGFRVDSGLYGGEHDFANIDGEWEFDLSVSTADGPGLVRDQPFRVTYALYYDEHATPWPLPPRVEETTVDGRLRFDHLGVIGAGCAFFEDAAHRFFVHPGAKSVVAALEWDPADAVVNLQEDLSLTLHRVSPGGAVGWHLYAPIADYGTVRGGSPLLLRTDAGDLGGDGDLENVDKEWALRFRVCATEWPNQVIDQPFRLTYHVFYHEHAPVGYDPLAT